MKRYLRYLLLAFVAVACVNENELSEPFLDQDGEAILVPRVKSFTNQYVTKAGYAQDEAKITSLAVLVFNSKGEFVHHEEASSGNLSSMTLNKTYLAKFGDMKRSTLVMFANVSLDAIKKGGTTLRTAMTGSGQPLLTLQGLQDYAYHHDAGKTVITDLGNGFAGFPMTGRVDGIDLSATLESQAPIEIGLRILYAKVNFSISVAPGSENEGTGMQFVLDGYSVHNISKVTSYKELQGSEATVSTDYAYHQEGYSVAQTGTTTLRDANPLTFTFYLAESRFAHGLTNFNGIYPAEWLTSAQNDDVKNYTQLSPEEQAMPENWLNGVKYHYDGYVQQYKPLVANASADAKPGQGLATYVLVKGAYTDYRGTVWDVNYKVYLGKDNGQNFQVDRNSEYKNYLTIKGIRNNDSDDGRGEVWFDHRVDVSNPNSDKDASDCVTITRETLIDAHIEVRPLRVTWPKEPEEKYAGVRVYLPTNSDGSLVNWIGMERFTGTNNQDASIYCYQHTDDNKQVSTGKRKYFTTSLIAELQAKEGELGVHEDNGRKYIYLMNEDCAWIYFDENTALTDRTADIRLAFYDGDGTLKVEEVYVVTQRGLLSLGGYRVEHYEEYLHTYDSADQYNLSTSPVDYTQQGLSWGLENRKISKEIIVSAVPLEVGILGFQDWVTQRYDYFHQSDRPSGDTYYPYQKGNDGNWSNSGYGTGQIFTDRASENEVITVKDMGTLPENAYQYCLSKNKFAVDNDGNVTMKIHWYLPDVYEMRDVLKANSAPQGAVDFGVNALYWTSQPSYSGQLTNNIALIDEVPGSARAVSASSASTETPGVDEPRHVQHRIRCLYSSKGIEANMDNRTPDGVGGNYTFTMKAYESNSNAGYFNYMLPEATREEEKTSDDYDYTNESFPIPTASNPGTEFDYFSGVVDQNQTLHSGFKKNPTDVSNWKPYERLGQKYYYTLYSYPGLSEYELKEAIFDNASRPTTTKKSDKKVEREVKSTELSKQLTNVSLNTLDHLKGGNLLNIVFANGNNSANHPQYGFVEIEKGSFERQTVRNWRVPTYPETSYTPSPDIKTEEFTGVGSASETGYNYIIGNNYSEAQEEAKRKAKENALSNAMTKAQQKYPNRTYKVIGTPDYDVPDPQIKDGRGYRTYTYTVTCTVTIQCTATATPVPYYALPENWGWYEVESKTVDLANRETDELHIYGGNSFTISVTDPDYEITKVKVHYSGNNVISSNGLFSNKVVQRFVDAEEDYPENQIIYRTAEASLQMPGMEYSTDGEKGWHQWTGSGRASVTLELVEYAEVEQNVIYRSCGFRDAQNLSKYLIIDKIEVKCTKKPEAQP